MKNDVALSSSPTPGVIWPDTANSCTLTSTVTTQLVAFCTNSATDLVFAALLKDVDKLESLGTTYGAGKKPLIHLDPQIQKHFQKLEQTQQQQLEAKTQENKFLHHNVKKLKNTSGDQIQQ